MPTQCELHRRQQHLETCYAVAAVLAAGAAFIGAVLLVAQLPQSPQVITVHIQQGPAVEVTPAARPDHPR